MQTSGRRRVQPRKSFLRSSGDAKKLAEFLQTDTGTADFLLSRCPRLAEAGVDQIAASNIDLLQKLYTVENVKRLVVASPEILQHSLREWWGFFSKYGLSKEDFFALLRHSPRMLDGVTVFGAGNAFLFLKKWGWTNQDIIDRLMTCYPEILRLDVKKMQKVVDRLHRLDFADDQIRRLVREFPSVFTKDFNRDILPILDRIRNVRRSKYTNSGTQHV